jgi:hypothetical protein
MSSSEQITSSDTWLPQLSKQMEEILIEAITKTGRSREEILHFCLKQGIERMLEDTEKGDSP